MADGHQTWLAGSEWTRPSRQGLTTPKQTITAGLGPTGGLVVAWALAGQYRHD